jgi:hypothetical protein
MILQTKFHVITQWESERETERESDSVSTSTTHFRNDRAAAEYEYVTEFTQECWIIVMLSWYYYYDNHDDSNCIRTKQFPHTAVANRTFLVTEIKCQNYAQHYSLVQNLATIFSTIIKCWKIESISYKFLYEKQKWQVSGHSNLIRDIIIMPVKLNNTRCNVSNFIWLCAPLSWICSYYFITVSSRKIIYD